MSLRFRDLEYELRACSIAAAEVCCLQCKRPSVLLAGRGGCTPGCGSFAAKIGCHAPFRREGRRQAAAAVAAAAPGRQLQRRPARVPAQRKAPAGGLAPRWVSRPVLLLFTLLNLSLSFRSDYGQSSACLYPDARYSGNRDASLPSAVASVVCRCHLSIAMHLTHAAHTLRCAQNI